MANVKNNLAAQETKRRLIEAAGEIFAEVGYERATIKEITDRAGAASAAVNYHFSDKQELYYQVVRLAHDAGLTALHALQSSSPDLPPHHRLRQFIRAMLANTLDDSRPVWHGILIAREIQQPTAATDRLIEETLRSYVKAVEGLITDLAGRPLPPRQLALLTNTVIGQSVFYCNHKEIHARLYPDLPPAAERIDEIADHITRISLAAVDAYKV